MKMILAIGLGGALGAISRHFAAGYVMRLIGSSFPFGTLFVNVLGSLVMGLLVEILAHRFSLNPAWRGLLAVGFLGGFTTFSSFSLEVALLVERNTYGQAFVYALASVLLSVSALFLGLYLGRMIVA